MYKNRMTHRFTPVEKKQAEHLIAPNDQVMTIGSCFAENIGQKLAINHFRAEVNPLGVIYNPVSLASTLKAIISNETITENSCHHRKDVYFHYDYHSELSAMSASQLTANINTQLKTAHDNLSRSKWLLLTLGTSVVHKLKSTGEAVCNCHKMPSDLFEKSILTSIESTSSLADVLSKLSHLTIVLTVSPIRHTKEGLVDNQLSKSRLIDAAHTLSNELTNVSYFPAYEIMMDELRDYRYYKQDLIHPTKEAIDIIWERFRETYFATTTHDKYKEVSQYLRAKNHKPLQPESEAHHKFLQSLAQKETQLRDKGYLIED